MEWRWSFWVKRPEQRHESPCPSGLLTSPNHKIEALTRDMRVVSGRPEAFNWDIRGHPSDIVAWRLRSDHPQWEAVNRSADLLMYEGPIPDGREVKVEASPDMFTAAAELNPLFGMWA